MRSTQIIILRRKYLINNYTRKRRNKTLGPTLDDFGRLGRLWTTLDDSGRLRTTLDDFGRILTTDDYGRLWTTPDDSGRLWEIPNNAWWTYLLESGSKFLESDRSQLRIFTYFTHH